jgi:hypothetical protein
MEKVDIKKNSPPKGLDIILKLENGTEVKCFRCTCPDNECICYRDVVTRERVKTIKPVSWRRLFD